MKVYNVTNEVVKFSKQYCTSPFKKNEAAYLSKEKRDLDLNWSKNAMERL